MIAWISIGAVFLLLAGTASIYAFSLAQSFDSAEKIADVFPDEANRPAPPEKTENGVASQNILLLGSDTRGSVGGSIDDVDGGRSDTMMIAHISADRTSIHVMSLMRDSWVEIPGYGVDKLNAASSYGGVPLTVQTIEGLLDNRIDHVAIVDFTGFKGITEALGGVTVNNAVAFSRGGYSFDEGPITVGGDQALIFVRERKSFDDGDYQRVRNQQAFIKGVMDKTLSKETLSNPVTISNLVGALSPFLTVDEGLNAAYAGSLGFELRNIRSADVKFLTLPTLGTATIGTQSTVQVDFDELAVIAAHFRADTLSEYEPKRQSMSGSVDG